MKVKTLGDKSKPAIIMIPGMFCTGDIPGIVGEYLKDEYFVILPTLDGHHKEEPVYHDKATDAGKIIIWCRENEVSRIALLQGTSMGAEVALETARQMDIAVEKYLFDGGPFFNFPGFFRAIMATKFNRYMAVVKGKDRSQAVDELMKDPFVKKLGGNSLDTYRDMLVGFWEIGQWIDKPSVRRIADTCYHCELPEIPKSAVRRFNFLYSGDEPARKSEKRLKNHYPEAAFIIAKGYGHGGFQGKEPERYAQMMRDIIAGRDVQI